MTVVGLLWVLIANRKVKKKKRFPQDSRLFFGYILQEVEQRNMKKGRKSHDACSQRLLSFRH